MKYITACCRNAFKLFADLICCGRQMISIMSINTKDFQRVIITHSKKAYLVNSVFVFCSAELEAVCLTKIDAAAFYSKSGNLLTLNSAHKATLQD